MPLEKAPYWTDLYYRVVEHYFWSPHRIGRKSDPEAARWPWNHWKDKLGSQETPLNHILDFLFHIAPERLLDQVVSALLPRPISGLKLVAPSPGTIDYNVVQPDIIVSNSAELVFIEIKVDSRSSIDQFAKYAIAAHCIRQDEPAINSVDLILLGRSTAHGRVWKRARKLGLFSDQAVREVALRALQHEPTIWGERGVQRYIGSHPEVIPALADQLMSMGLHLRDYCPVESALRNYASEDTTLNHLIDGVLHEFTRRRLVVR
jgi:hypothetical protein